MTAIPTEHAEWRLNESLTTTENYELLQLDKAPGMEPPVSLLSSKQSIIIEQALVVLYAIFSTTGTATNAINVYTFLQLGWKESMTLTLLFLSCSDLTFSAMQLVKGLAHVMDLLESRKGYPFFSVDPFVIQVLCTNVAILAYSTVTLITTNLAITRCMCVARPLHFKTMFTTKRTLIALLIFVLFPYVTYLAIFVETGTTAGFDPIHNISRTVLWVSARRAKVRSYVFAILFLLVPIVCQVLIIVSVVYLIAGLRSTSNFRKAMKTKENVEPSSKKSVDTRKSSGDLGVSRKDTNIAELSGKTGQLQKDLAPSGTLSGKELQAARQVVLICVVFFITGLTPMGNAIAQMAVEGFGMGRKYHDAYILTSNFGIVFLLMNSCTTVIIYLKFNTAFRKTLSHKKP